MKFQNNRLSVIVNICLLVLIAMCILGVALSLYFELVPVSMNCNVADAGLLPSSVLSGISYSHDLDYYTSSNNTDYQYKNICNAIYCNNPSDDSYGSGWEMSGKVHITYSTNNVVTYYIYHYASGSGNTRLNAWFISESSALSYSNSSSAVVLSKTYSSNEVIQNIFYFGSVSGVSVSTDAESCLGVCLCKVSISSSVDMSQYVSVGQYNAKVIELNALQSSYDALEESYDNLLNNGCSPFVNYYMNYVGGQDSIYNSTTLYVNTSDVYNIFNQFNLSQLTREDMLGSVTGYVYSYSFYQSNILRSPGTSNGVNIEVVQSGTLGSGFTYTIKSYEIVVNGITIYKVDNMGVSASSLTDAVFVPSLIESSLVSTGYITTIFNDTSINSYKSVDIDNSNSSSKYTWYPTFRDSDYIFFGWGNYFALTPSYSRFEDAYNSGFNTGYNSGFDTGHDSGFNSGFNTGYASGMYNASQYTFIGLMGSIVDAPLVALFGKVDSNGVRTGGLFNLTILGVDMTAFMSALLSLCLVIVIVKLLMARS